MWTKSIVLSLGATMLIAVWSQSHAQTTDGASPASVELTPLDTFFSLGQRDWFNFYGRVQLSLRLEGN
jgi:hypothetical protein